MYSKERAVIRKELRNAIIKKASGIKNFARKNVRLAAYKLKKLYGYRARKKHAVHIYFD